ncbi:MAG: pyruvate kinase [Pontiellaceae bacterium]|nr:pyruvate kinase [Verrucomicrobiota bacterium]
MYTKQTKIVCTIAHNRCEPEFIKDLFDAGMNVARLNTAHIEVEDAASIVKNLRSVSDRIGILIDTKGPEVRIRDLETPLAVVAGETLHVSSDVQPEHGFCVNYDAFVNEVPIGSDLLIDDGEIHLIVDGKESNCLICRVTNSGEIKNRKSVNVPGVNMKMPSLTDKDARFVEWATDNEIEFIAHSFVRNRDDVMAIQSILDRRKSPIKIIAKIENREGIDNLDAILDCAHGVMVARGDLGIEVPAEEVPNIQKRMISTSIKKVKPVITATQMLHSMIDNPRPTRAEVSDVANAIYDGTDALMLSGETAYGKYAVEAVQTMTNIAKKVEAEKEASSVTIPVVQQKNDLMPRNFISKSAVEISARIGAKVIITSTRSGDTAQICASYRCRTPIVAYSETPRTVRELSLTYGVYAQCIEVPPECADLVNKTVNMLIEEGVLTPEDVVCYIGGGQVKAKYTNLLQIDKAAYLIKQ